MKKNIGGIKITEHPITLPSGGGVIFICDENYNAIRFHQNG